MGGVGDGSAGAEGGGDDGGFGEFGFGGAGFAGVVGVDVDAVGALGGDGYGDGDEFLVFNRDGAVGDGDFVEGPEGFHGFGSELVHFGDFGELSLLYIVGLF